MRRIIRQCWVWQCLWLIIVDILHWYNLSVSAAGGTAFYAEDRTQRRLTQGSDGVFAYLAKICRNFSLRRIEWNTAAKRNAEVVALTKEMEACIPDPQHERKLEGEELGEVLNRFLETLSYDNRVIFLRRYWYVDTITEIAVRYGISESAVQMRLIRTRSKLAEYLAKEGIKV